MYKITIILYHVHDNPSAADNQQETFLTFSMATEAAHVKFTTALVSVRETIPGVQWRDLSDIPGDRLAALTAQLEDIYKKLLEVASQSKSPRPQNLHL